MFKKCTFTGTLLLCTVGIVIAPAWLPADDTQPADSQAPEDRSAEHVIAGFEVTTAKFLQQYCVACHGKSLQEAGLRFDNVSQDLSHLTTSSLWRRVLEQVLFLEMPPRDSDSLPDSAERSRFVHAVEAELTRFGRGLSLDEKLLLPEYGNFVDHDRLFDGTVKRQPYTPARLWRQRPDIYRQIWG